MNKKNIFFGFLCMLTSSYGQAYIYRFFVMKKKVQDAFQSPQLVIGLGDYHDNSHGANAQQRSQIVEIVKKNNNCKLIVEDLSSVNNDGRGVCCNFIVNAHGGILGKLADEVRSLQICVDNVEYRYCRVSSLGPLLRNNKASNQLLSGSSGLIPLQALLAELFDEIEKIKKYNDGVVFNQLYKQAIAQVLKRYKQLGFDRVITGTIADYCATLQRKDYRKKLEKICMFDSHLIDMKIMHSVMCALEKQLVIIAAGGTHVENVATLLAGLGYERIEPQQINIKQPYIDTSTISTGKTFDHLPAVDLCLLNEFIH